MDARTLREHRAWLAHPVRVAARRLPDEARILAAELRRAHVPHLVGDRLFGIGFVPWGPVGMGYLTGTINSSTTLDPTTDLRAGFERFTRANLAANRPVVDLLQQFAARKNATPAQLALAWLLAQKPLIVPIPGTRNPDHLAENLKAVDVRLTAADLRELDAAFSTVTMHGGRMNAEQMQVVDETK